MDKINFKDEEILEKFKEFFDEDDIDEKNALKIYEKLDDEEKEEFDQYLIDDEDEERAV